jgi:hypothetical protein
MYDLNGFTIEGHQYSCVIFKKNEKFVVLDAILRKQDLILMLGILSANVSDNLKDHILDEGSKKGPKQFADKDGKPCLFFDAVSLIDDK